MMNDSSELIEDVNQILNPIEKDTEATLHIENDSEDTQQNSNHIINDSSNNKQDICEETHSNEIINHEHELSNKEDTLTESLNEEKENNLIEIKDTEVTFKNNPSNGIENGDHNNDKRITELEDTVFQKQKRIDENENKLRELEQKFQQLSYVCSDMECRLKMAIKQCDAATKEKEGMVMRYAVSEKNVLDQRAGREQAERRLNEAVKEKDLLQHKLAGMVTEKARICQMLDNKCYEFRGVQQELDRAKADMAALETKLKWSQNSLRTEMELHKESGAKVEILTNRLQEVMNEIEKTKREAEESIKNFHQSQENRAHVLDQQLKEQQATLILEKHEREEREHQISNLKFELDRLQTKHQLLIEENNSLSLKVQQLERERLENEQKLSELRGCADQHRQDEANLSSLAASVEQLRLQLTHEQEQREASTQQLSLLKQRNSELEIDMDACRVREADMLLFTQQLTDKNVRLQSEFSALETKVQQLTCEQTLLKRTIKEHETRSKMLSEELEREKVLRQEEGQVLARHLAEKTKLSEHLGQQLEHQKGENLVIKRKLELSVKEVTKELQQCRRRLEQYEHTDASTNSRSSSSSSLNVMEAPSSSPTPSPVNQTQSHTPAPDHQIIQPDNVLDRQVLIDHIVKLQRASAKKSEKLDFLEEHVQTLVMELQRKSRLLQAYMVREQTGALSSSKMDNNKAELAKQHGVMASVYGSKVTDSSVTLELSLDINRKLQAVLEDTLLKNITLKENVDTLGCEIERLNKLIHPAG